MEPRTDVPDVSISTESLCLLLAAVWRQAREDIEAACRQFGPARHADGTTRRRLIRDGRESLLWAANDGATHTERPGLIVRPLEDLEIRPALRMASIQQISQGYVLRQVSLESRKEASVLA